MTHPVDGATHFEPPKSATLVQHAGSLSVSMSLYGGDGELMVEPYFPHLSRLPAALMRYEIPPGASEGLHCHDQLASDSCTPNDVDELYLVTSGELVMLVDGEPTELAAGDGVYVPSGRVHGISNKTTLPASVLVVYAEPSQRTSPE